MLGHQESPGVVRCAVEGTLDEAVAARLVDHVGGLVGPIYGKSGKAAIRNSIRGYNHAAQFGPWFVLVDLDEDFPCAPHLVADWLPRPADGMRFRVAVHEVEAWLLADKARLAAFLRVSEARLPIDPDALPRPKEALVDIARHSRNRAIKDDVVPRPKSGRTVGPAYSSRMIEFVRDGWRPEVAAIQSASLASSILRLQELVVWAPNDLKSRQSMG